MQCRPGLWTRFARYPRSQNVPYFTTQELVVREGGGGSRRYLHHWWPKKCNVGNKTKRKNRKYSWLHNENDLIKHNQNHHESETVDVQGYKIWQDIAWKLFCENPLVWRCFFFLTRHSFRACKIRKIVFLGLSLVPMQPHVRKRLLRRLVRMLVWCPKDLTDLIKCRNVKGIFLEEMLGPNGELVSAQTCFGDWNSMIFKKFNFSHSNYSRVTTFRFFS